MVIGILESHKWELIETHWETLFDCSQIILYLSQPLGKSDGLGRAGGPAGGSGEISATAMVPYSAAQAAMALKKAKKESLAEAVKLAASTAAAAAAKLASTKTQIKGKCFHQMNNWQPCQLKKSKS